MISRYVIVSGVIALVAGACSEFQPGRYEGGGRSGGTITVGGAGSGCNGIGSQCQSSDECCSHLCEFTGQILTCVAPKDSGPACTANNGGCQIDSDCCSAFCSPGKLCTNPPLDSGGGG